MNDIEKIEFEKEREEALRMLAEMKSRPIVRDPFEDHICKCNCDEGIWFFLWMFILIRYFK